MSTSHLFLVLVPPRQPVCCCCAPIRNTLLILLSCISICCHAFFFSSRHIWNLLPITSFPSLLPLASSATLFSPLPQKRSNQCTITAPPTATASSSLIPLFLPTQSPHLQPPLNTPQINKGLIRVGGDAGRITRSAGRKAKEKAVCHCSLSLLLCFHLWFSLFPHRQPSHTGYSFPSFSFCALSLSFLVYIFRNKGIVVYFLPLVPISLPVSTNRFFIICIQCVNSSVKQ